MISKKNSNKIIFFELLFLTWNTNDRVGDHSLILKL